jgi:hypothetical protein
MKKAQATLETIIMLVVLLVLAGVMISLILTTLKPPSAPERVISKQEFLSKCENYCNDPNRIAEYCRLYWNGNDWNENKIPNEIIQVGPYNWYTCEDRIYCFLVSPCERLGSGLDLMRKCRDILCGLYMEKYEDEDKATEKLLQDISFSRKCTIVESEKVPEEDDWYTKVFKEGCAGAGAVPGGGGGGPPM